jgi:hypothetical protein
MNLFLVGLTLGMIGKLLLAVGILRVHNVMAEEHAIDQIVIKSFKTEKVLTIIGILCIILGYTLEIYFYMNNAVFTCHGDDCQAALILSE